MTTATLIILKASSSGFSALNTGLIKYVRVNKLWWVSTWLIKASIVWSLHTLHLRRHATVASGSACINKETGIFAICLTKPLAGEAKTTIITWHSARMGRFSFCLKALCSSFCVLLREAGDPSNQISLIGITLDLFRAHPNIPIAELNYLYSNSYVGGVGMLRHRE